MNTQNMCVHEWDSIEKSPSFVWLKCVFVSRTVSSNHELYRWIHRTRVYTYIHIHVHVFTYNFTVSMRLDRKATLARMTQVWLCVTNCIIQSSSKIFMRLGKAKDLTVLRFFSICTFVYRCIYMYIPKPHPFRKFHKTSTRLSRENLVSTIAFYM